MDKNSKIYIAGHTGMVGSAIWRNLSNKGYTNLRGRPQIHLDLLDQQAVNHWFATEHPEYVIDAAARVGGIVANNTYRAQFIYENLTIQNNLIHAAWKYGVKKLLFLGSSCIYPKNCPQPIKEEYLLTGPLEPTNEPYAVAKIAGIKMCESYWRQYGCNFISVMPVNLYGPRDNFDLEKSHVIPGILRKMHLAKCLQAGDEKTLRSDFNRRPVNGITGTDPMEKIKEAAAGYGITENAVELLGSGMALREFMFVDDLADACVYIMENVSAYELYSGMLLSHINIGTGEELHISELAQLIKLAVGYEGELKFDRSAPDGVLRKHTDITRLHALGWKHSVGIKEGINKIYDWYLNDITDY